MTLVRSLRQALPVSLVATIDYHLHPAMLQGWGGPLNGQCGRQQIVVDLLRTFPFTIILETGTFRGTTTDFLARESKLPVYTVEADPTNYAYARRRFRANEAVRLFRGDSREFLKTAVSMLPAARTIPFVYLDAHWEKDLPLLEELQIVFENFDRCAVMIDDFEVPGDKGYGFDDYGDGKVLSRSYLEPVMRAFKPLVTYPALPSNRESGIRRGSCVIVSSALADLVPGIPSLRTEEAADRTMPVGAAR